MSRPPVRSGNDGATPSPSNRLPLPFLWSPLMVRYVFTVLASVLLCGVAQAQPAPLVLTCFTSGPNGVRCPGAKVTVAIGGVSQNGGLPFVADANGNISVPFTLAQTTQPIQAQGYWVQGLSLWNTNSVWPSYNSIVTANGIPFAVDYFTLGIQAPPPGMIRRR